MLDGICLVILGKDIKVLVNLATIEATGSLMGLQKKNCEAGKCVSLLIISWSVEFPVAFA